MNKHERVKHEKDPLDAREDLLRGARGGRAELDDGDLFRLKWHGLYEHNSKDGHFMLRVKVVQGILSAEQAETLAWIAEAHGRGMLDCTTRQPRRRSCGGWRPLGLPPPARAATSPAT